MRQALLNISAVAIAVPLSFAVAPDAAAAACKSGYVGRDAKDGDQICVTPAARKEAKAHNANAANNRERGDARGPNTCRDGFVWREAFAGDVVCVTPLERQNALVQNTEDARRPMPPPPEQQGDTQSYPKIAREGYRLERSEAASLESLLEANPGDLAARTKLLGFYFRGAVRIYGADATIAARRRHILWLVRHHPGSEIAALSEVTIDPTGHALADKDGYEQLSTLWKEQVQHQARDVAVLGNAAKFFQLSDKEQSTSLLEQAQRLDPGNRQWSARIGYVYALGILGVDMINQNGLPSSHNPEEARGHFAIHAMDELGRSPDPVIVGVAGRILGQYGVMMTSIFRNRFAVDYAPLAESLLIKAQDLEPANRQWSADLDQFRKLQSQAGRAR
jgi:hypothetical protein